MLIVHRAQNAHRLVDALAADLAEPLADPMQTETVAVAERGVERWLRQQLSLRLGTGGSGDGIAANIDFGSPRSLLRRVIDGVTTDPDAAESWFADRLRWPVLQVLDAQIDDPRLQVIAAHLGHGVADSPRRGGRLATATTIARFFSAYGWQRPGMIAQWAAGEDTDGAGNHLGEHLRWQPWLWRLVREEVGHPHLAEGLDDVVARLRSDPSAVDLPERIGLFGAVHLPQTLRVILGALAEQRRLSLYLPHPSPTLWDRVAAATPSDPVRPRTARPRLPLSHPLLGGLSRDLQEFNEVLAPMIDQTVLHDQAPPSSAATDRTPQSLLGRLQDGLWHDDPEPTSVTSADGSVEVHACHGPARQVEVLRDRLMHLFAEPGPAPLEPREVIVLCPDIETYAPLISAVFDHDEPGLRVRLADRGLREQNGVLDVLARVLDLAAGRVRSGELVELIGAEPVRRRFRFSDEDLETLAGWIDRSGIRWGLGDAERSRFGLDGFPQGTVQSGLDRILLGVVAEESENEWLSTALPMSGIDSTDTDLVGRFAECVQRIRDLLTAAATERSTAHWHDLLIGTVDALTATDAATQWQRGQAVGMLTDALLGSDDPGPVLDLADMRDLVATLLRERPSRSNYCTGELTVCAMGPMRSVPHRVVVLLGMDADGFPRPGGLDGDDILQVVPVVGEPAVRDADRQLFLDAIGAATEHLLVFYTGADPLTGARTPPTTVVSELLDTARVLLDADPKDEVPILHRHTLHAFDEANFVPAGPDARPFSHDRTLLPAARALRDLVRTSERGRPAAMIADELLPPADRSTDIDLDSLISFLTAPVEGFARQRLGLGLPDDPDEHSEDLPVALTGLERWGVGDRYLAALLADSDPLAAQGAELRRGSLPPFAFGAREFASIRDKAQAVATAAYGYRDESANAVDVKITLPDGRRIDGTVGDVFAGRHVLVSYSRLAPKHRLAAWIRLLAIAAGSDADVTEAIVVGSGSGRRPSAQISRLHTPADAAEMLAVLVAIRDAGLNMPIGLTLDAGSTAASVFGRSGNAGHARKNAKRVFDKSYGDRNRYANIVFRGDPDDDVDFETLAAAVPSAKTMAEVSQLLPGDDTTDMYVRLATAVFGPLLANEESR